jgi:hypothetical protein
VKRVAVVRVALYRDRNWVSVGAGGMAAAAFLDDNRASNFDSTVLFRWAPFAWRSARYAGASSVFACNYVWCDAYDDPRKILLFSRASEIDLTDRKSMAEANHPASFMYITAGTRLNTLVILSTLTLTQASLE